MQKCLQGLLLLTTLLFVACSSTHKEKNVVVYTTIDQPYAEKIFKIFEEKTSIKVIPVYDTEASKGIGLQNRLIAEKNNPKADVFWNSEPLRTIILTHMDLFTQYLPSKKLPYKFNNCYDNKKYFWFGIGARYRTIAINSKTLKSSNLNHLLPLTKILTSQPAGKIAISLPYAGTATTHFVALYSKLGERKFKNLFKQLIDIRPKWVAGNSLVVEGVANEYFNIGLCDSDDIATRKRIYNNIHEMYYNQKKDGNFLFFGTLSKIKNGPHSKEADIFMNFMLRPQTEIQLIKMGAVQAGVFQNTPDPMCKTWTINPETLYQNYQPAMNIINTMMQ